MNETCARCQGNGEIVVDWSLYLGKDDGSAVAECLDCDGTGTIPPQYTPDPALTSTK
jgi:DnaJ-class molecular chaperone